MRGMGWGERGVGFWLVWICLYPRDRFCAGVYFGVGFVNVGYACMRNMVGGLGGGI
jgi:hypothetical protein